MITSTPGRLTIVEPSAKVTALAMAEGGVALLVDGAAAYLDRDDAIALMAWLSEVTA